MSEEMNPHANLIEQVEAALRVQSQLSQATPDSATPEIATASQPILVPTRRPTQVDPTPVRRPTQVDSTPARKPTQVDSTPTRKPTQFDSTPTRKPTQVDSTPTQKPPQVDTTSEREPAQVGVKERDGDPSSSAGKVILQAGNWNGDISSFQDAAAKLTELVSTDGKKYLVKQTLSRAGGQAAILLCSDEDGKDVVAKILLSAGNNAGTSIEAKQLVLDYMHTPEGLDYTLPITSIGLTEIEGNQFFFEITPFCKEGDLANRQPMSFDQLKEVAHRLNEALHSMHQAGILHRDIKESNLYYLNGKIVIGDFGVAKRAGAGATETNVRTEGYSAPETLFVAADHPVFFYDEACDYYSLGVTLGCLYEGRYLYENMNAAMITAMIRQGRLPLRRADDHRDQLENLLNGLVRFDPRYRFGYEDVCKWLEDPKYTGGISDEQWPRSFRFMQEKFDDEKSLFFGITKDQVHWNEARAMLYQKYFEQFFVSFRPDLARAAQIIDETWRTIDQDRGLAYYLKELYAPGPIVWKGYTFNSLSELAGRMTQTKTPDNYAELLQKRIISHWLKNTEGIRVPEETLNLTEEIEALSDKFPEIACYWFGFSFAESKTLQICGAEITDMQGLIAAMFRSPYAFYCDGGYEQLMDQKTGGALYGFLYSLGMRKLAEESWRSARDCDTYHRCCLLLDMLDAMAEKAGSSPTKLRSFFHRYGPVGIGTFAATLVSEGVYIAKDKAHRERRARGHGG